MATILERIQYGFDSDSRRTWRRRSLATGEDYRYGYDGLSQVVSSDRGNLNLNCSAIAAVPKVAESWDYDPIGNWHGYKVESDGAVTLDQDRVHDKGNRLMQIEGDTHAIEMDRVGRITQSVPEPSGNWSQPLQFKWDAWSRIKEVIYPDSGDSPIRYFYDGLNRRIMREYSLNYLETFYSDEWKPLEERVLGSPIPYMQYLWGTRHRDDLVRRDNNISHEGVGETRYVLMDYFSPAAITDEEGTITERYDFTAFGVRRILAPDSSPRSSSECGFEFAFQGQFLDAETGFLNYGFRYYSPHLGRWMCKDPIGIEGGLNIYATGENDPINTVDLLGLIDGKSLAVSTNPDFVNKVGASLALMAAELQRQSALLGKETEFCGLICEDCDKSLYITGPIAGTNNGSCRVSDIPKCDEGDRQIGIFHSHPSSKKEPIRAHMPSEDDYIVTPPGQTNYVGTYGDPLRVAWPENGSVVTAVTKVADAAGRTHAEVSYVNPDGSVRPVSQAMMPPDSPLINRMK